jgi:ABC-type glucose/galactose transport system permease subunit
MEYLYATLTFLMIIYGLFCVFISSVDMPDAEVRYFRYQFKKNPRGFIKISRYIGFMIAIVFGISIACLFAWQCILFLSNIFR